jgi:hypothetical protein
LKGRDGIGDHSLTGSERRKKRIERRETIGAIRAEISRKRHERRRIAQDVEAARLRGDDTGHIEHLGRLKSVVQELFQLEQRLRAAKANDGELVPGNGALPDFSIIGAPKCGTTYLYHLLSGHPQVEPAAFKEPHFFDHYYEKGPDWYCRCFPQSHVTSGGRSITGEATPSYLSHPDVPERMAETVPEIRLIALLRDPVDMIYSGYNFFGRRRGRNVSDFDEYVERAFKDRARLVLSQGIYVEQLLRWSRYFATERMLVLKSEDFFENPLSILRVVSNFLGLPPWEPDASQLDQKRNKGIYEGEMEFETRRRLREFYEPHNRRLCEYLGRDFGW